MLLFRGELGSGGTLVQAKPLHEPHLNPSIVLGEEITGEGSLITVHPAGKLSVMAGATLSSSASSFAFPSAVAGIAELGGLGTVWSVSSTLTIGDATSSGGPGLVKVFDRAEIKGGTLRVRPNGRLEFEDASARARTIENAGVITLSGHIFFGGNENPLRLTNQGLIEVSPSSMMIIDGTLTNTGKIDVNHGLVLNNQPAFLDQLRQELIEGRGSTGAVASGKWDGASGITSSSAADAYTDNNKETLSLGYALNSELLTSYTIFLGQPVNESDILTRLTRNADANLDGIVNNNDITILAGFYRPGVSGRHWYQADFNYDGEVNNNDITILAGFYAPNASPLGASGLSEAIAAVPEPSIALLAFAGGALMFRRRRVSTSMN